MEKEVKRRQNVSGIKIQKDIILLAEKWHFPFQFSRGENRFTEAAPIIPVHYPCLCDTEYTITTGKIVSSNKFRKSNPNTHTQQYPF